MNARMRATLAVRIEEQRRWMLECGSTLSGYVRRYGSAASPDHYGDGGEAIYRADRAELDRLLAKREAA